MMDIGSEDTPRRGLLATLTAWASPTDEQTMWRVRAQDDAQAFARLMRRWLGPIESLCVRMTNDYQRGQDLAQEAFVRLYARRKEYQATARFATFLWRVALNLCYDELRRRRRRFECSLEDLREEAGGSGDTLAASDPAPDVAAQAAESAAQVRQALAALPEDHRAVVILRHYEHLKFREIAAVLQLPESTVKSRLAEALSQLQQQLNRAARRDHSPCRSPHLPRPAPTQCAP